MNRRIFNKLGLSSLLLPLGWKANEMVVDKKMTNIFVHHVYFWLNKPDSKVDLEQLVEGLRGLSKASSIKSFHLGVPAGTSREVIDGSYAISWLTIFANAEDEQKYQVDPIHLDFIDKCKHLWSKVVVFDSIDYK
ncbi:MAG TPA: Dabb family protein [Saprospiraceae bacterium]|nr:Dabb family protein [Saprospiraceae bacterium]